MIITAASRIRCSVSLKIRNLYGLDLAHENAHCLRYRLERGCNMITVTRSSDTHHHGGLLRLRVTSASRVLNRHPSSSFPQAGVTSNLASQERKADYCRATAAKTWINERS